VWQEAIEALADGLVTAQALYDVDVLVLGGGLAEAGDTLSHPLGEAFRERVSFHRAPRFVRADLGDEAGCIGAALLALDHLGPR
ncbi:MAG TPA: ROK family protein, partial [Actinoplanes sp.]|nr:ROK family protein [Actinoplanes sp.]